MAYATYRLYYETEIFDEDAYYNATDFLDDGADDVDLIDPDDFYREESLCVAIIVVDIDPAPGEIADAQLTLLRPDSPLAPDWYTTYEAELVAAQLADIVHTNGDGTFDIRQPQDPSFDLETGAVVNAKDLDTATLLAMDTESPTHLFNVYCIEYSIGDGSAPFPVALLALDPIECRIVGEPLGSNNPFAPPQYNRSQRRKVERRFKAVHKAFTDAMASSGSQEVLRINPARIMGPEYRNMLLPPVEARDIFDALDQARIAMELYGLVPA